MAAAKFVHEHEFSNINTFVVSDSKQHVYVNFVVRVFSQKQRN